MQKLLLSILLLALAVSQTNFKNTCQSDSMLPLLATGSINLNPFDTYNNGANKDYYQDLSTAKFQTVDVLGYAFALSGFQTNCGQNYYTLNIDKVFAENQNTRMKIVVDFRNPSTTSSNTGVTKWTQVSFNYLVVSRNFNGLYSTIWASSIEATSLNLAANINGEIDTVNPIFTNPSPADQCYTYADPNFILDPTCDGTVGWDNENNPVIGGSYVVHAYIMGFKWNSNRSSTSYLSAGVFAVNPADATFDSSAAELIGAAAPTYSIVTGASPAGPRVFVNNQGGALEYIKMGFVFSIFDSAFKPVQGPTTLYPSVYLRDLPVPRTTPGSYLSYSSSYIFEKVSKFNTSVPIKQGDDTKVNFPDINWNQHYMRLPDNRYSIFGLTGFNLPKNSKSNCTATIWINATLDSINTYTVNTPNANPADFFVSGDIFTVNVDKICPPPEGVDDRFSFLTTIGQKDYFTVPTQSQEQFILEWIVQSTDPATATTTTDPNSDTNAQFSGISDENTITPTLRARDAATYLQFFAANNGNNDTVIYRASVPYLGLRAGSPIKLEFGYFDGPNQIGWDGVEAITRMEDGKNYSIKVEVNGLTVYQEIFTSVNTQSIPAPVDSTKVYIDPVSNVAFNRVHQIFKGININSTVANVVITVSFVRSRAVSQSFYTYVALSQYLKAYDPSTGCCVTSCPTNTGLDTTIRPPTCVACNTQAGLFFNPNEGGCTCLPGFYLDSTKTFQCYKCSALYCSICNATRPEQCLTCVTGAVLGVGNTCTCGTGYFVNGTTCQQCPYQCQTCSSPNGACTSCVNAIRRDITQNCKCIAGFYDSGAINCTSCNPTCQTCTNGSSCTSCSAAAFRNLTTAGMCACMNGYYELYLENQTRVCRACSKECQTCSIAPTSCLTCDPTRNRILGVDSFGRSTCICLPGYFATADGSCVQSNCNADPFCSQCEQGLKLCVQCLASKNRIIKLPESICVCMDGFYANANNECVPCGNGCGICSSATNCTACVTLATASGNGVCACPQKTYFTVSTDGARYCAACGPYCNVCVDASTCTTCMTSFTKTVDNQCVCSTKNFIDTQGNCVPCATGCQTCTAANVCTKCIDPLVLQGNVCQAQCNNGFTALGSVCRGCPEGCLQCTQNFVCYYCADGFYMYNGACYKVCPAGTIGDSSSANWVCNPCNSPCKTCINHPSYCTSCENGKGYLQTSAVIQSCVQTCNDGTYANNGVCEVCDFKCATCLGSASNCISCPQGQLLYKGGCWATCPGILLSNSGAEATCVDSCPDGFYKYSTTTCAPCSIQCTTCDGGPNNCTSCLQGSVATNGTCTTKCGENEFSFSGVCVACDESCYGCSVAPTNCQSCAAGYVRSGSICQKGCLSGQFFDAGRQACANCPGNCASCSSANYCTVCSSPDISPRGGVCSSCPYPCNTCDGSNACTSCLSGFYYFQGLCQTTCPAGAIPNNSGNCVCVSGIVANGRCVASCNAGFTAINGACVPCNSNCASCSGNINVCTSCINGFSIDSNTKRCVSVTQCPYGQESNNGNCENICNSGFFYYQGICIYGGCFTGYVDNGFGGCTRSSSSAQVVSCSAGQFLLNGACVSNCGVGYYGDSLSQKCLSCSSNCASCLSSSFCVACRSGFQVSNGVCVATTSCSANQLQFGSSCVSTCPIGAYQIGSQCLRSCPANTYYSSQICYLSCPSGLRTGEACVTTCPAGTSNKSGVCS